MGKLQCHPYPHEYSDPSKNCSHCAFFMGLQRKQGEVIQEGQQFDIRGTVDEFRHSVNMYVFWRPGMEIFVSHVRRKQIPVYVFPEGHKPSSRVSRSSVTGHALNEEGSRKRKGDDDDDGGFVKRQSVSPVIVNHGSSEDEVFEVQPKVGLEMMVSVVELEQEKVLRLGVTSTA